MSSILTIVILLTTTTSIAIGLAGLIVGVGGRSWLKSPLFDYGLWSVDILGVTLRRNNILEFKISYDVVLVLIIIGAAFALMAFLCALTMFCCQKNPSRWRLGSITLIILTFIAGGCGLAAVIYAEIVFRSMWSNNEYKRGYAAICAWIGACACFVSLILSCINICLNPSRTHTSYISSQKSGYAYHNEKVLQMDNLGYR